MTPFACSLVYPLRDLQLDSLRSAGWAEGRLHSDVPKEVRAARLGLHDADQEIAAFLDAENSRHARSAASAAQHLRIVAVEAVQVDTRLHIDAKSSIKPVVGYLVLHVQAPKEAPEDEAMTELGELARPKTPLSRATLTAVGPDPAAWTLSEHVDRVATIALTVSPEHEEPGMVSWPDSTAVARRLASLVVLRERHIDVPCDPLIPSERPTPSYEISSSMLSTAVCRFGTVGDKHLQRLRTHWVDVLLLELIQHAALSSLANDARKRAGSKASQRIAGWSELNHSFRTWRTSTEWRPDIDHPFEQRLGSLIRNRLGTPALVERVERELRDHADAERIHAEQAMARAVFLLTVAAAVVPLLLQLSQDGADALGNGFFVVALLVSVGVSVAALRQLWPPSQTLTTWPETPRWRRPSRQ